MSSEPPQSIWTRPEPGARGAAHSRADIAAAAIKIADADGFKALSMRRVAAELGAGTMTLYHYVKNKDELIELIDDAVMGELIVPDGELPEGWREAITELGRRSHATFLRHPWTTELPPATEGGPNGMKHFEQSLQAVVGSGLEPLERMEIIFMVDDYVFGSAIRLNMMRSFDLDVRGADARQGWKEAQLKRMAEMKGGGYPNIAALYGEGDPDEMLEELIDTVADEDRFERGLSLLLDGIERGMVDR